MFTPSITEAAANKSRTGSTLLPVTTFVLWVGCLTVGALGIALPYQHPQAAKPSAEVTQAEMLNVELANEMPAASAMASATSVPSPQPLPRPLAPLLTVAAPAFAIPAQVALNPVTLAPTNALVTAAAPVVQSLTFGVGDGVQPAPVYPREAMRAGQEGKVAVRFCVAENGRVVTAEAAKPSPFPLLNDEAVRTVRKRWQFRHGPPRVYEVTICFQLNASRTQS